VTPVTAAPAILLGTSICDNQADAFGYQWKADNVVNTRLFFMTGNNVGNGAITAVGHADAFNASGDVYIEMHGRIDGVANFNGQDFATVFLANHPAPTNVSMYVCQAGTQSAGAGTSSMARLARSYPGVTTDSTVINMTAPAPNACPALQGSAGLPIAPIINLAQASIRTDVQHVNPAHTNLVNKLVHDWNNTNYPGTVQSFGAYCTAQLANAPGGWLAKFIADVVAQFNADYLALINTNYAGNNLVVCGPGVQCD